jgi:hypothetical protein
VTPREALKEVQRLASKGYIRYVPHARQRMQQRRVKEVDVKNALLTAGAARWRTDHQRWEIVGGVDVDGDDLTVAVEIEADVVVITVI